MGNFNVLISDPWGGRTHKFETNVSREVATEWLQKYRPAPTGWSYQIINTNREYRKARFQPEYILVIGFTKDRKVVGSLQAAHKSNEGRYTVKMAKRDLRAQGAHYFTRDKVYADAVTNGGGLEDTQGELFTSAA